MATKTNQYVETNMSPYRLAKVLSNVIGSEVAPQYLYTLTRGENPRLPVHLSETGHQVVTAENANAFIQAWIDKLEAKAAEAEAEAEVEELDPTV